MASPLNDLTLNILSSIIVSVIIATHARRDLIFLSFIVYAMYFTISFFVPGGGQLNAAIAISAVLYAVFAWTTADMVKTTPSSFVSQYEKVPIFEGSVVMNAHTHKVFDTYDPQNPNYRRLSVSQNRMGGAQFSYSFWVNFGGAIDSSIAGKTIFMRGDKRKYSPYIKAKGASSFQKYFQNVEGSDVTIACPRVYFKSENTLGIQVNTDRELLFEAEVGSAYSNHHARKNMLSLIPRHWALITVIVEDNVPINDFENGIAIKTYVNDTLYGTSVSQGSLRMNNGALHILGGDQWPADSRMSDLIYYNYALSDSEVRRIFNAGPDTSVSDSMNALGGRKRNDKLQVGDYNKMDIHNYNAHLQTLSF
eukprot:jgi/Tetstr1/447212/TSEL_034649.t1